MHSSNSFIGKMFMSLKTDIVFQLFHTILGIQDSLENLISSYWVENTDIL
jgi:hypothetical protein